MRLVFIVITVLFSVVCLPLSAHSQTTPDAPDIKGPEMPLASVGKDVLMPSDLEKMIAALPPEEQEQITPEKKKAMVNNWIQTRLLAHEGEKRGLADRPDVKRILEEYRLELLSRMMLLEISKNVQVTEEDMRAYFDAHKEIFTIPETIRLRIMTLPTKEEAQAALKRLAKEDFADVAKELSTDKFKDAGGEVGLIAKSEKLPEYLRAAFYLQAGATSDIIEAQEGFCILKVTEKFSPKSLVYEELDPQLKAAIEKRALNRKREEAVKKLLDRLEKETNVTHHLELLEKDKPTGAVED